jgi:signal transduction histidine kinase
MSTTVPSSTPMRILDKTLVPLHLSQAQLFLSTGLLVLIISCGFYYLKNLTLPSYSLATWGLIFGTISSVILGGMTLLYCFAYRFYEDSFYLFVALGWLGNVVHVFFETFFVTSWDDIHASIRFGLLSAALMIPFYVAGCVYQNPVGKSKKFYFLFGWIGWFVLTSIVTLGYVSLEPNIPDAEKFKWLVGPTLPFSVFVLWMVGNRLRERLNETTHGRLRIIFPATFYGYALLQPIYLFKLDTGWRTVLFLAFVVALFLKIVNSFSVLACMYRDYVTMQARYAAAQTRFERERYELEVAQAKLAEKSALEDLGRLTASIQHDIRNPLIVIESEVEKLMQRMQAHSDVVNRLKYVDEQKNRIFKATNLVPLLRGSDAYFQPLMRKVAIDDLVNRTIKAVKREMTTSGIYFRVKERSNEEHIFVRGDAQLIEQAVTNVLKNSVEAIKEVPDDRSGVIYLDMGYDTNPAMVRLEINDNGSGISEEDLPNVTSLFTTRDEQKANSGLGLFITNRIMRIHGGDLKIDSTKHIGTTVSLLIPRWRG